MYHKRLIRETHKGRGASSPIGDARAHPKHGGKVTTSRPVLSATTNIKGKGIAAKSPPTVFRSSLPSIWRRRVKRWQKVVLQFNPKDTHQIEDPVSFAAPHRRQHCHASRRSILIRIARLSPRSQQFQVLRRDHPPLAVDEVQ